MVANESDEAAWVQSSVDPGKSYITVSQMGRTPPPMEHRMAQHIAALEDRLAGTELRGGMEKSEMDDVMSEEHASDVNGGEGEVPLTWPDFAPGWFWRMVKSRVCRLMLYPITVQVGFWVWLLHLVELCVTGLLGGIWKVTPEHIRIAVAAFVGDDGGMDSLLESSDEIGMDNDTSLLDPEERAETAQKASRVPNMSGAAVSKPKWRGTLRSVAVFLFYFIFLCAAWGVVQWKFGDHRLVVGFRVAAWEGSGSAHFAGGGSIEEGSYKSFIPRRKLTRPFVDLAEATQMANDHRKWLIVSSWLRYNGEVNPEPRLGFTIEGLEYDHPLLISVLKLQQEKGGQGKDRLRAIFWPLKRSLLERTLTYNVTTLPKPTSSGLDHDLLSCIGQATALG